MVSASHRDSVGGGSSRIFPWSPQAVAIHSGGGVVVQFFRGLQKPSRFSGGGVVAEFFRGLRKPSRFAVGGGVVSEFCRGLRKPSRFTVGGGVTNFYKVKTRPNPMKGGVTMCRRAPRP